MIQRSDIRFSEAASTGALVLLPFLVLYLVLALVAPYDTDQMHAADPIVQAFHAWVGIGLIPILSIAVCGAWLVVRFPGKVALERARRLSVAGGGAAVTILLLTWLIFGESLPGFIPPEEGTKPGMLLGLGAGISEEVIFRLTILPLLFLLLSRVTEKRAAVVLSILATGLLFALAHEIGPGAGEFDLGHFITRFALPGSLMSAVFFRPGPPFVVSLHCTAHIVMPFLFS